MKNFLLYPRLALISMSKNKKTYIPYLLTCVLMVMIFYIVHFLSINEEVQSMPGGTTMSSFLELGQFVIAIFAAIFLYYTNTFLIRRRKKEFGLYNVLGMGKRNLACILVWETILLGAAALALGLFSGVLFSKLAQLVVGRFLGAAADFHFPVEVGSLLYAVLLFSAIFAGILVTSLFRIHIANPIDLVKSEAVGEKPPKANWLLALLGCILLAVAYAIAIRTKNPLAAITLFFLAVVLVILATYLLFISGSVAFCRLLQRRRSYYYKPNHFVSVSSMVYRMKHNGAGLASLCILSTMVLVMMTSTLCLFIGEQSSTLTQCPREVNLDLTTGYTLDLEFKAYDALVERELSNRNLQMQNAVSYRLYAQYGRFNGNAVVMTEYMEIEMLNLSGLEELWEFRFVPQSDYNAIVEEPVSLSPGEVYLCASERFSFPYETIDIQNLGSFSVAGVREQFDTPPLSRFSYSDTLQCRTLYLIIADLDVLSPLQNKTKSEQGYDLPIHRYFGFDLADEAGEPYVMEPYSNESLTFRRALRSSEATDTLSSVSEGNEFVGVAYSQLRSDEHSDRLELISGLLFLCMILSAVFLIASVLMIYYKQITEGYDDRGRFEILQKVGMTKKMIKKTINSQVLTVFFLPLAAAGIHLAAAFNIVSGILRLLYAGVDLSLFVMVNVICYLVFAVFYTAVYLVTSRAYYQIVKT